MRIAWCWLPLVGMLGGYAVAADLAPDPARVAEIAAMLPREPRGPGPRISDRRAWDEAARRPQFQALVKEAGKLLSQPMPEVSDELYLDFSQTGNRGRCEAVQAARMRRLTCLATAECLEDRGRFLPALEETIASFCREKAWVMPAHDRGLKNFSQEAVEIDLRSADVGWNLAVIEYWLGERLKPATRKLLADEIQRRIYAPFTSLITTGKPPMWWITGTNNWNSVCLGGVTGTALAQLPSPERRAWFVAAAEKNVRHFLDGITPDGYCSEGLGYWGYGFGRYLLLAEAVHQATGGQVDLFDRPKVAALARFATRLEILPGIYPAFADCSVGSGPEPRMMAFLSRKFSLGLADYERRGLLLAGSPGGSPLGALGLWGFENSASRNPPAAVPEPRLRDWFSDAGILICRPAAGAKGALGAALKGGHNNEHHNHNDVGSFVVARGGGTPLLDPGAEVYTARTFSGRRYESQVINSFGHPVPLVAGALQRTGAAARAKILKTELTDAADTLVLDLRSAYAVEGLKTLRRTFVFARHGDGSLTVTDEFEFDRPRPFGTALITFSPWKELSPGKLVVGEGNEAVLVTAEPAGRLRLRAEEIREDVRGGRLPVRLGLDYVAPAAKGRITLAIRPAS